MSLLKLSEHKRHALWLAHRRKCVYCGEPVRLGELDIDHILPEASQKSESEMSRIKSEFGLPTNFDLNSFLNLVPSHHRCNLQKRDRLFKASTARYYLDLAASKERTVRQLEDELLLESQKDRILAAIRVAVEHGRIGGADLFEAIHTPGAFRLATTISFEGEDVSTVHQNEIERLLDKVIVDDFTLANSVGNKITIRTCREYKAAIDAGFSAQSNVESKFETTTLLSACTILRILSRAKIPTISYVNNPFCGVADLRLLPQSVVPYFEETNAYDHWESIMPSSRGSLHYLAYGSWLKRRSQRRTVRPADWEDTDTGLGFQIIGVSSTHLEFQFGYNGAILDELLRADIDDDGLEEILVRRYTYAVEGTLGFGEIGVLRRLEPDSMFQFELL